MDDRRLLKIGEAAKILGTVPARAWERSGAASAAHAQGDAVLRCLGSARVPGGGDCRLCASEFARPESRPGPSTRGAGSLLRCERLAVHGGQGSRFGAELLQERLAARYDLAATNEAAGSDAQGPGGSGWFSACASCKASRSSTLANNRASRKSLRKMYWR